MNHLQSAFLTVLNMSLTASYVAVGVLLVRALLRRSPKIFSYILWSVVLFRLVCPYSIPLAFSALNLLPVEPQGSRVIDYVPPPDIAQMANPAINMGVPVADTGVNRVLPQIAPTANNNPMELVLALASVAWVIGIVILLGFALVSYVRIARRLDTATLVGDNIYESDQIGTAFVCGFLRPRIYMPAGIADADLSYILEHERTHIRRKDHLLKPLAFIALIFHWFNPLMWLSFSLMSLDMEMSCDEAVLKRLDGQARVSYSGSLLSLSMKRSGLLAASPLAFSESDVKVRIKNVLSYKRAGSLIVIVALVAVVTALVAFASNPQAKFDLEKTQAQAMLFSTAYTDPVKVGEIGVLNYYSTFMGKSIPQDFRIADYGITDIQLLAGDIQEFCVLVTANYFANSMSFFSANGHFRPVEGGYRCEGDVTQFRIKSLGGDKFEIIGIGTGGLDAGLIPIAQNVIPVEQEQDGASELDRIARNLLDRNYDVLRIYRLGMLPLEGVPTEPKPGEHIYPVKDDRFKTFEELEDFIRTTYVKEQADALLNDGRYMDVEGRLHGDIYMYGGMGYFTDWVNYRLTLSEVTPDSAFITMKTGSYTGVGPDEIILTVSIKNVNGLWLLERMIL